MHSSLFIKLQFLQQSEERSELVHHLSHSCRGNIPMIPWGPLNLAPAGTDSPHVQLSWLSRSQRRALLSLPKFSVQFQYCSASFCPIAAKDKIPLSFIWVPTVDLEGWSVWLLPNNGLNNLKMWRFNKLWYNFTS